MTWAINAVIKLGREFCGSESHRLVSCLALKSREYYRCVHEETFQILKQMIDNDPWVSLGSLDLGEVGGILCLVRKSVPGLSSSGEGTGLRGMRVCASRPSWESSTSARGEVTERMWETNRLRLMTAFHLYWFLWKARQPIALYDRYWCRRR